MKRRLFYKNHYGRTSSLEFNLRLKEVLKIFATYCFEKVLDIGCGDGIFRRNYGMLATLKRNGVFVLTTPNLGSLYNRLCLLLGYQPFGSEVSLYHDVGHLFRIGTAGHIRCFTLRSLKELTLIHGFKVYKVVRIGINTKIGVGKGLRIPATVINKILQNFPSLASDLLLVLGK